MWKDIKGWEDYYEVNDNGDVRNKKTGHFVAGDVNSAGYYRVCLYNKNNTPRKQRFFRHRLVAEHFIPNPNCLPEVNHIDNDKRNNNVSNLEWCTRIENEIHSHRYGSKLYKPYQVIFKNGIQKTYHTTGELARELNLTSGTIKTWIIGLYKGYEKYGIVSINYLNS